MTNFDGNGEGVLEVWSKEGRKHLELESDKALKKSGNEGIEKRGWGEVERKSGRFVMV